MPDWVKYINDETVDITEDEARQILRDKLLITIEKMEMSEDGTVTFVTYTPGLNGHSTKEVSGKLS